MVDEAVHGVALYVRSSLQSSVWTYSADDRIYALNWGARRRSVHQRAVSKSSATIAVHS